MKPVIHHNMVESNLKKNKINEQTRSDDTSNNNSRNKTSYLWARRILHRTLSDVPYFVPNFLQRLMMSYTRI